MMSQIVFLEVPPEKIEYFLLASTKNAAASVRDEPGCMAFDVVQDTENPSRIAFYEVYKDRAAITAHRDTPHFAEWRQAADLCIVKDSLVKHICEHVRRATK